MDLYNFNPPNRKILIDKVEYELKALSIKILVKIQEKFGDFESFQKSISIAEESIYKGDFPLVIAWLAHGLLQDQSKFPDATKFYSRFLKQKEKVYHQNVLILFEVIKDAQPLNITQESKGESDQDYFSKSYVFVARETGITIDDFYNLTLRQINQIQDDLNFFKNNDLEFQAKIHGAKLLNAPGSGSNAKSNFTKEEDKILTDFAKRRMEQIKNEKAHNNTPGKHI